MVFIVMSVTMNSCSANNIDGKKSSVATPEATTNYSYNSSELETMKLINKYRVSIGLKALQINNYISSKCEEHTRYMIKNNDLNHNGFASRSKNIVSELGAKKVGENVAYNYQTSKAALQGWLKSAAHKENIEGDYTHFGISVLTDANGKKYYTNIFVKI